MPEAEPERTGEEIVAPRMPWLRPAELDAEQRVLYEAFVTGPRQTQAEFFPVANEDGILSGPYNAMLLSPAVGAPMERLGRAVRYDTDLPDRMRELAILTVAHLNESEVEWRAHEGMARAAGVPEATILSLKAGSPRFEERLDEVVHTFVSALLVEHRVDDGDFAAIASEYGRGGALELVATVGYYQLIAHLNNAFAISARPGAQAVTGGRR